MLAAGAALGGAELLAGALGALTSPIELIGDRVIDGVPPVVKDAAIAAFGTADKLALQAGTVVIALLVGAGLGVLARRVWTAAALGFVAAGVLGIAAAAASPRASLVLVAIVIGVGVAVGLTVLRRLLAPGASAPGTDGGSRRQLLVAAVVGVGALGAGVAGRWLLQRDGVDAARTAVALPDVSASTVSPARIGLDVEGVSRLFTPNDRFYRIDTALRVPQIDPASWQLRVTGLVDRELTLRFDELRRRATEEADITIACVSNEVGGQLVGNARWQGVALRDLLDQAGVRPQATQVVGRSVDGFTAAFPVAAGTDDRASLVALGMNGEPLPVEHGFPARLVVPGLYGYVSATKWLAEIELVTDAFEGYWVPRGWAKRAPIKTQSRIDVPAPRSRVVAGRVPVAGVAWAPTRGISAVGVRVDDGPWRGARLGPNVGDDSWRQWVLAWDATPGSHRLHVRATDGTGQTQTEQPAPPRPDGATGYHTVAVGVDDA
ncbi:MAG: molybdopterin-dependent oxidoreductase [Actinobacteria bacterium]|nr:molybdopterin-dependent oxidoreductase [Actinomycetota bacterium]